jgi:hypothetical protein
MMMFRVNHGKSINWVIIMYFHLVKESIKWEKSKNKMIKGTAKR